MTQQTLISSLEEKISLSLGLSEMEKTLLLEKLPRFSALELKELLDILDQEEEKKHEIFHPFFDQHPHLFPDYQRLHQDRTNAIYSAIEEEEKKGEQKRLESLLNNDGNS